MHVYITLLVWEALRRIVRLLEVDGQGVRLFREALPELNKPALDFIVSER